MEAGKAAVQLGLDDKTFQAGLKNAMNMLRDFGSQLAIIGNAVAAAGAAMLAPFVAAMKKFTDMGTELSKLSAQTGVSARSLAELSYALDETGGSTDALKGGFSSMAQFLDSVANHSHESRKALSQLGLSMADLRTMNPEDQFSAIAHAIGEIEDPSRQAAAAMKIFGGQGDELLPLIKNLDKLRAEAVASGMMPSKEAIEGAKEVGAAMRAVSNATKAFSYELAAAFQAVSKNSLATMKGAIQGVTEWIKKNQALVAQMASTAKVVAITGAVISGVGVALFGISAAAGMAASAIGVVSAVVGALVSPIALVTGAVVAGIAAWAMYTESGQATVAAVSKFFGDMLSVAKDTIGGITDALTAGDLELAGKIAVTGLQLAFATGMQAISQAIGGVWGETLGKLTADIAGGDLQGAWETAILALASVWDEFCSGIWKAFSGAANGIITLWEKAVAAIAKMMLANKWIGKGILMGTGVDMEAEQARRDKLNAAQKANLEKQLADAKEQLEFHGAQGDEAKGDALSDNLRAQIKDLEGSLANVGKDGNVLDEAGKAIDQQVGGSADLMRSAIAAEGERREETAKSSESRVAENVAGGDDALSAKQRALQAQLAALRKEAHGKAAKDADDADAANHKRHAAAQGTSDSIAGTFSAAALASMGGSGNIAEKQLDETKGLRKDQALSRRELQKMRADFNRMVIR